MPHCFKLCLSAFVALVAAHVSMLISSVQAAPINLLTNPGFEAGNFSAWTVGTNSTNFGVAQSGFVIAGADPIFGHDAVIVHSGNFAAYSLISCPGIPVCPNGVQLELSQIVFVPQNTDIDVGFYFGNGSEHVFSTGTTNIAVDGTRIPINIDFFHPLILQPGQYALIAGTFNSGNKSSVTLSFTMNGSGSALAGASFDDFFATPTPEPASSISITLGFGIFLILHRRGTNRMN
jgi:hypothetical protein